MNLKSHSTYKSLKSGIVVYALIVALAFVPLFVNLGAKPIQLWDESRMATSAYEMYKSNQLLVPTFQGGSDIWNTKPPLLIWLQYVCLKIFGVSEFSLRLPSALAGLGLCIWIAFWIRKIGLHPVTAIFSILLIINSSFTGWHGLRTGDYEALLTLFLVVQALSFLLHLKTPNDTKYLNITLIATVFGVLTKGICALFLVPVMIFWWFNLSKMESGQTMEVCA